MDVKLPKLGEGADSGVVVSILVSVGQTVAEGETIFELENEKAVAPIPSPGSGTVTKVYVKEGDTIHVGQALLALGEGQSAPASDAEPDSAPEADEADEGETSEDDSEPTRKPSKKPRRGGDALLSEPSDNIAASPTVRKLARDLGIDLSRVRGTERGGRIGSADLKTYIQTLQERAFRPQSTGGSDKPGLEHVDFSKWGRISRKAVSPLRKIISQRMTQSLSVAPQVTQFDEADITDLMALRKQYAPAYEAEKGKLTLTVLALKAVVRTLQAHPVFNASLDDVTGDIVHKEYYHLGLAVDTEAGLLVPVLRNVDQKSLLELSKEVEALATRARERRLTGEEMKGGSFTLSNQGGIGSGHFTPIVNVPEVAILGMGRGLLKPVHYQKETALRLMLPLALSYDHRVIDGGTAARFMVDLVQAFQDFPSSELEL